MSSVIFCRCEASDRHFINNGLLAIANGHFHHTFNHLVLFLSVHFNFYKLLMSCRHVYSGIFVDEKCGVALFRVQRNGCSVHFFGTGAGKIGLRVIFFRSYRELEELSLRSSFGQELKAIVFIWYGSSCFLYCYIMLVVYLTSGQVCLF